MRVRVYTTGARLDRSFRGAAAVAAIVVVAAVVVPAAGHAAGGISCQPLTANVAIVEGGPSEHQLAGTLCRPAGSTPESVQLLVHGATYDRAYWDWPDRSPYYSYVRAAVAAGYATFSVDRLGAGVSSHPPSTQVTLRNGATALHGVVGQLRSGSLGGSAFEHVVWIGHSFGSIYAWTYAMRFDDIDAYVLTGQLHAIKRSWLAGAFGSLAPAGGGLDPGYLTTLPGTRDDLFYYVPTTEAAVIATDEATKDTVTAAELQEGGGPPPPPEQAPSRSIHVPTLLVVGENDNLFCGPPDGLDCTETNVLAAEAPYYSPAADLGVEAVGRTGHVLSLHLTAPLTHLRILHWTLSRVPPHS